MRRLLQRYLQGAGDEHLLIELTECEIRLFWGPGFHGYYSACDPAAIFERFVIHEAFHQHTEDDGS